MTAATILIRAPAGTPLGDPVEVNAASAVLLAPRSATGVPSPHSAPLTLAASKSWHGHGEPAAGLIALLHGIEAMETAQRPPVLHLREINPHVSSILQQARAAGGSVTAARQPCALPLGVRMAFCGTSSFAFMVCAGWLG